MSKFKKPTNCDCSFCVKPDWLTAEEHVIEVGIFLGYPKCCTKESITRIFRNRICSYSFPHSSPLEFKKYLKKIKSKYVKPTTKRQ